MRAWIVPTDLLSQRTEIDLRQCTIERGSLPHQRLAAIHAENEGAVDRLNLGSVNRPNPKFEVPRQHLDRVRMTAHDYLVADTQRFLRPA